MEPTLNQIVRGDLTHFSREYCFSDFASCRCMESEEAIAICPDVRLKLDLDKDDFILARFGRIPLPVAIYGQCEEHHGVSESCPAFFRLSPQGDAVQIFLYKGVPLSVTDSIVIHELYEAELCFYYGVPQEVAHRFAVHFTYDYVRKHYNNAQLKRFSEFENNSGRSFKYGETHNNPMVPSADASAH